MSARGRPRWGGWWWPQSEGKEAKKGLGSLLRLYGWHMEGEAEGPQKRHTDKLPEAAVVRDHTAWFHPGPTLAHPHPACLEPTSSSFWIVLINISVRTPPMWGRRQIHEHFLIYWRDASRPFPPQDVESSFLTRRAPAPQHTTRALQRARAMEHKRDWKLTLLRKYHLLFFSQKVFIYLRYCARHVTEI